MQVSWIDPDEIRRLVAQLAGPEPSLDKTAWELHTLPIATPTTQAHNRLLDTTDTAVASPPTVSPKPTGNSEGRSAPGPQNAELWRIRERLRRLREKAQQAGIITPSAEAPSPDASPVMAPVMAPIADSPQPSSFVPVAAPEPQLQPHQEESTATPLSPEGHETPSAMPQPTDSVVWATREDSPVAADFPSEIDSEIPHPDLPSTERLGTLAPLLAQAAAALAAHAQSKAQRISSEPASSPLAPAESPPKVDLACIDQETSDQPTPLTLRSATHLSDARESRSEFPIEAAPSTPWSYPTAGAADHSPLSPPAPARLSLRIPPHLVGREKQEAPNEVYAARPTPPVAAPQGSASVTSLPPSVSSEVEPLFGPIGRPLSQQSASQVVPSAELSPSSETMEQVAPDASPPNVFVDTPSHSSDGPVQSPLASENESTASDPPTASAATGEATPTTVESIVADEPTQPLADTILTPVVEPEVSLETTPPHQPPATTPSVPILPPLLPFAVPALGLSERLASLAEWACKGLATEEVLLVDDYGDVLWGGQGQTALVLSAMMAWHSAQRSAPASAVAPQQRRIDKELACGRRLTVIPARTRYGVVSLAAIRQQSISDLDANRIHDALMMSVEATGLNRIA